VENKRVEIAVRIDGNECFYVVPEGFNRADAGICHGLDAEVEEIIRSTVAIQGMETSIIRMMVVMASSRLKFPEGKRVEIVLDEKGRPAVRNAETGEISNLYD
jgi:hypothetical protein